MIITLGALLLVLVQLGSLWVALFLFLSGHKKRARISLLLGIVLFSAHYLITFALALKIFRMIDLEALFPFVLVYSLLLFLSLFLYTLGPFRPFTRIS